MLFSILPLNMADDVFVLIENSALNLVGLSLDGVLLAH